MIEKTSPREPGASPAVTGWAPFKLEPSEQTVPGGRSAGLARSAVDASWTRFWNFSGGMESAAMIYLCREEIKACGGHVCFAHTGKQFPEMDDSIAQISEVCGLTIDIVRQDYSFDEFLFERGGVLKQGYTDCSRRMKRVVLNRYRKQWPQPWQVNLGYNADELQRAWDFSERNDRPGKLQWAYPLIDKDVSRLESVKVCIKAGFTVLVGMYQKMGRFDCFWCPNQKIEQAQKVMIHYPKLWEEWKAEERKKGHPILSVSATAIETMALPQNFLDALDAGKSRCSCFGGETFEDEDDVADARGGSAGERVSGPSELSGAQEPNIVLDPTDSK